MQPGGETRSSLEVADALPGGGERFLRQILGLVDIAGHVNQKAIDGLVILADDFSAGMGMPPADLLQQALVIGLGQGFSACMTEGPARVTNAFTILDD